MTREAEQIAAKLDAEIKEGRNHTRAVVRLNGHDSKVRRTHTAGITQSSRAPTANTRLANEWQMSGATNEVALLRQDFGSQNQS